MKIKCLAVDDEPLALDIIQTFAKKNTEIEKLWIASNAVSAAEILRKNPIEVMFLDIQMPQITGLEFIRKLQDPPLIIFTTAYSNYAVEGFEVNAIDYILKPFSIDRFEKAVNKAMNQLKAPDQNNVNRGQNDFLYVKANHQQNKVYLKDIKYVEAFADYVKIFAADKRYVTLQTMKNMEAQLPKKTFIRVHRSYIAGLNHIDSFTNNSLLIDGKKIPVGKNYRNIFLQTIQQNKFLS